MVSTRTDSLDQDWTLDGLGNFAEFDDNGTSQTRDVNGANEITSSTGIATPVYGRRVPETLYVIRATRDRQNK